MKTYSRLKILGFLIIVSLNSTQVLAIDISGYYEHQLGGQKNASDFSLMSHNRLRIDIGSELNENIIFKGNIIAQTFHGKTKFSILDFIPEKFHAEVNFLREANLLPPEKLVFEFEDRYVLDNAFITFYFPSITIRAGKQQIPWGTGYVWNPTSIFHVKSILEPGYELPGVNAMRADVPFSGGGGLSFVFAPGETWNTSNIALRVKEHVRGFDLSLSFINKGEEERRLYGGDFAGEFLGLGIWGELAYNRVPGDNYIQFVCGFDYTFEFQTHIMMEYYHNGLGKKRHNDYVLNDWLELISGRQTNLAKDYIFMRASHPATDLMEIGCSGIVNLNDRSFFIIPELTYNLTQNVDIIVMLNLFQGDEETEYGEFSSGGFIRTRIYF